MTQYSPAELVRRRDDWYTTIRRREQDLRGRLHRVQSLVPRSPALQGEIEFDYSKHDGYYIIGQGDSEFLTRWSRGSNTAIYAYSDNTNVAVAAAPYGATLAAVGDASMLDFSSRVLTVLIGEIVVFENHKGRYAAVKTQELHSKTHGAAADYARMAYWILDDGSSDFTTKA